MRLFELLVVNGAATCRMVRSPAVELREQTSQFHKVALKPYFERFVAMDWNGDSDWSASLGVYMVAAVDALQRPSM